VSYTPPTTITCGVTVTATCNATLTNAPGPTLGGAPFNLSQAVNFLKGTTAAGTADTYGFAQYTIPLSSTQAVFLSTGTPSLVDEFGQKTIFARVKGVVIYHMTTTAAVSISWGVGTHPFRGFLGGTTDSLTLNNGGVFTVTEPDGTGYAVTNASNDQINIINNDAGVSATVLIVVLGSSA